MATLPPDIEHKINQLFSDPADRMEVKGLLLEFWNTSLNVGPAQLARSILTLCGDDIQQIRDFIQEKFFGDPRDVIMMAEIKTGNPGHYFLAPFDEMDKLS